MKKAIPTMIKILIETDDEEIIKIMSWTLSYISRENKEMIDDLLNQNLLQKMITLMNHETLTIALPCLKVMGDIANGDEHQTQKAVDHGLIKALDKAITHQKKSFRKESCWVLSNITVGTSHQLQCCIDIGIIEKLFDILKHDDIDVKKEAVWALVNCTA